MKKVFIIFSVFILVAAGLVFFLNSDVGHSIFAEESRASYLLGKYRSAAWFNTSFDFRRPINGTNSNLILPMNRSGNLAGTSDIGGDGDVEVLYGISNNAYIYYNDDGDIVNANDTGQLCLYDSFNNYSRCPNVPDGLMGYFPLDDDFYGVGPLIDDVIYTAGVGGSVTFQDGTINGSYEGDNANTNGARYTIADNADLDFGTGEFAVAGWAKLTTNCNGGCWFWTMGSFYLWWNTDEKLDFYEAGTKIDDPVVWAENEWSHIVLQRDSSNNLSIWINGSYSSSTTWTNDWGNAEGKMCWNAKSRGVHCDEFHIYRGRSLTAAEIGELASGSLTTYIGDEEANAGISASLISDNSSGSYPNKGNAVIHNAFWTSDSILGSYIFEWNDTGSFVNDSFVDFGASNWSNITKEITASGGSTISWRIWANDSNGAIGATSLQTYDVYNSVPTTPTSLQCNNGNCNSTFFGSININASGSTDGDGGALTYYVNAYYDKGVTSGNASTWVLDNTPYVIVDGPGNYNMGENLAKDSNGVIYSTYRNASEHGPVGDSQIWIQNSTDGGLTWNNPTFVWEDPAGLDVREPSLYFTPNEDAMVITMSIANTKWGAIINSTDGGLTWGNYRNMTDTGLGRNTARIRYRPQTDEYYGCFVDHNLNNGTEFSVFAISNSTNNYQDWYRVKNIGGGNLGPSECDVIRYWNNSGGDWIYYSIMRVENANSLESYSYDNGTTWTTPRDAGIRVEDADITFLNDEVIMLSGRDRATCVTPTYCAGYRLADLDFVNNITWGTVQLLEDQYGGYTGAIQINESRTLISFYNGTNIGTDPADLYSKFINSNEVTQDISWSFLGTHTESTQLWWNISNISEQSGVLLAAKAYDGTDFSSWYNFSSLTIANASVSISLLSPANNYNSTTSTQTFSALVNTLIGDTVNVSLFVDDSIVATNTSGINGVIYNFTVPLTDGTHTWKYQACDNNSLCDNSSSATINVDANPPVITLTSPIDVGTLTSGDQLFINWSIVEPNIDSCWYVYDSTNYSVNCASTNDAFNYSGPRFIEFYANDTYGGVGYANRSWTATLSVAGETYETTVVETDSTTFTANVQYTSAEWNSYTAKLHYNGTVYTAVSTGSGDNVTSTRTISVPTINATNETVSFFWNFTLTNATGSYSFTSNPHNQLIEQVSFGLCGGGETPFLTLNTKDAQTVATLNATMRTNWQIYDSGGDGSIVKNETYQDLTEGNNTWNFCLSPNSTNYTISLQAVADGSNHAPSNYYLTDAEYDGVTDNVDMYLLNDSAATLTKLFVVDRSYNGVPEVTVFIQRYDVGTDTYYTVDMGRTADDGTDLVYLNWYDTWYRYILVQDGATVLTTNAKKVSESPETIELFTDEVFTFDKFRDIEYSLTFNESSNNFRLSYVLPSAEITSACLRVVKRNVTNDYTICETCETSSSATLYCNVANAGNGTFIATAYALGSLDIFGRLIELVGVSNDIYEELGLENGTAFAILLAGIVASFFFFSPLLAILGALLGVLGSYALGFHPMDTVAFISIVVVGGAIIYMWKR